ncbi:hypothetical protein QQP08_001737 [Theobroma cacao]|nr:hypothetical protein QQP08_001737 [Theobroma cacao]
MVLEHTWSMNFRQIGFYLVTLFAATGGADVDCQLTCVLCKIENQNLIAHYPIWDGNDFRHPLPSIGKMTEENHAFPLKQLLVSLSSHIPTPTSLGP